MSDIEAGRLRCSEYVALEDCVVHPRLGWLSKQANRCVGPFGLQPAQHRVVPSSDLLLGANFAAGVLDDRPLKAFVVGASFPWSFAEQLDLPLDIELVAANGSSLGSGIMVMNDTTCAVRMAHNLTRFFASESCGKCVPCQEGGAWAEKIMRRIVHGARRYGDLAVLEEICESVSPSPFPAPAGKPAARSQCRFPLNPPTAAVIIASTASGCRCCGCQMCVFMECQREERQQVDGATTHRGRSDER